MRLAGIKVLIVEPHSDGVPAWVHALQIQGAEVDHRALAGKGLETLLLGAVSPKAHDLVLLGPGISPSMRDAFRHSLVGSLSACRVAVLLPERTDHSTPEVDSHGAFTSASLPNAAVRVAFVALGHEDPGETSSPQEEDSARVAPPAKARKWRILLAEDDLVNQQVAEAALVQAGMTVETADNGQQALDRLAVARFDVVVMDIQMPVMDGLTATRHIRTLPAPIGHIPIVALTGNALPSYRQDAAAAGMNGFVEKPLQINVLIEAIQRATSGRSVVAAVDRFDFQVDTALDEAVLNSLKSTFGPALRRVQATLARDAPLRLERMEAALAVEDLDLIRREAHSLKSSSATFGLMRVSRISKDIEMACHHDESEKAMQGVRMLARILAADLAQLDAHMD